MLSRRAFRVSQVDPKFAEFFSAAQAVLREMSMRQVLLPAIAVQEEKSTDSVVRAMRRTALSNLSGYIYTHT